MEPRKTSSPSTIALTGFMAVGKTTAGRALASLLRWSFVDLDCEVELRSGRPIREIFAQDGEARFRQMEAEALRSVIDGAAGPGVIALGGGTFVQSRNAELLRQRGVRVVFLELPLEQLLQRCRAAGERSDGNLRPLAQDEEAFCALYAQRLPFYQQADLVVNTEGKAPEEIARALAQSLRLQAREPPAS
jgi:shikimate kinase